jgi:hypothetical protein
LILFLMMAISKTSTCWIRKLLHAIRCRCILLLTQRNFTRQTFTDRVS